MMRCTKIKDDREQCTNNAVEGTEFCYPHTSKELHTANRNGWANSKTVTRRELTISFFLRPDEDEGEVMRRYNDTFKWRDGLRIDVRVKSV